MLPRTFPVNVTAGGGEATPAHARAALIAAAETEIDGLRPFREGSPASRIHWPSVARGHGMMERKLISEADSRPLVVLDPRAPADPRTRSTPRCAPPARCCCTSPAARAAGCCCPATAARWSSSPTCSPGRQAHVRLALLDDAHGPGADRRPEPPRAGRVRLRPAGRPPAARARPHARRLPARRAGRAARPPRRARGGGLPGLRERAHRRGRRDGRRRGARGETPRDGPSGSTLATPAARGLAFLALCGFASLQWMQMLEPVARGRAGYAVPRRGVRDHRAARRRAAARARLRTAAAVAGLRRRVRARAARRRRRRRAPAPGPLGRAGRRDRARHLGAARRPRPVPRARRVDADRDHARRHGARHARRRRRVLAARPRARRAQRLAGPARGAVRRPGRGARPRRGVPLRRAARRCSSSPTCGWSACASATPARRRMLAVGGGDPRPGRRARPRHRRAVVRLRDVGALQRVLEVDVVHAGSTTTARWTGRATAASCCASRPSAPRTGRRPTSTYFDGAALAARPRRRTTSTAATCSSDRDALDCSGSRCRVRNLRSQTFVTAGVACSVDGPADAARCRSATAPTRPRRRALRRGDAYTARSSTRRSRPSASGARPATTCRSALGRFTRDRAAGARARRRWTCGDQLGDVVRLPAVRRRRAAAHPPAGRAGAGARAGERPARAQRLRAHLGARPAAAARRRDPGGLRRRPCCATCAATRFTYTESPPASAENLDGFLFDAKSGYCQQYSGAMALLLRMGGVPARVSTGFTSGSYDRKAKRVRGPRPRRPLVGGGLVRRHRLGDVRPDARLRARALAARRGRRRRRRLGDARARPTSAATSAATRAARWRPRRRARRGR